MSESKLPKSKQRQGASKKGHYAAQYLATYRNKVKRVKQSSGVKAAAAYSAEHYPTVLAKSSKRS